MERLPHRLGVDVEAQRPLEVLGEPGHGPVREVVALVGRRGVEHAQELFVGFVVYLRRTPFALAVVQALGSLLVEALDPLVDGGVAHVVDLGDLVGRKAASREQNHVGTHGDAANGVLGHQEELLALFWGGRADGAVTHGGGKVTAEAYQSHGRWPLMFIHGST